MTKRQHIDSNEQLIQSQQHPSILYYNILH